jgi:hypothetical protein
MSYRGVGFRAWNRTRVAKAPWPTMQPPDALGNQDSNLDKRDRHATTAQPLRIAVRIR